MMADVPGPNERVLPRAEFTRRRLLRHAMTIVGAVAAGVVPYPVFARQRGNADASGTAVDNTLALARAVNHEAGTSERIWQGRS